MSEVHIGKVLRELYLASGVKMAHFAAAMHHNSKTIYYHFGQAHLNTSILDTYEAGFRRLGKPVDLWGLIAKRRRGETWGQLPQPSDEPSLAADVMPAYGKQAPAEEGAEESVADLLRRAARLLDEPKKP